MKSNPGNLMYYLYSASSRCLMWRRSRLAGITHPAIPVPIPKS